MNKDISTVVSKKSIALDNLIYRITSKCKFLKHLPLLNLTLRRGVNSRICCVLGNLPQQKVESGKLKVTRHPALDAGSQEQGVLLPIQKIFTPAVSQDRTTMQTSSFSTSPRERIECSISFCEL